MFGDLNDCYGKGLQQDIAEANKLEQELIEDGNRYLEMIEEENCCITSCDGIGRRATGRQPPSER